MSSWFIRKITFFSDLGLNYLQDKSINPIIFNKSIRPHYIVQCNAKFNFKGTYFYKNSLGQSVKS